jgi:hypothetical protein
MEGFVEKIMPCESTGRPIMINYLLLLAHGVGVLRDLRVRISRTSNWRKALYQPDEVPPSPNGTNPTERWNFLKHKVQSTMVFGPDLLALVDILAAYEDARKTEACGKYLSMAIYSLISL